MPSLSETIARLAATRGMGRAASAPSRLSEVTSFGSNPGALRAHAYLPDVLPRNAPLVVVLHGCTQSAADYDHGSGWSQLADRHGFALLFPEQQRENNPNLCFNWFLPNDIGRDGGEAASIAQMIAALVDAHALDRRRVFITGLSAGGAMAVAMLASYPEVFASGAILAGLPFGCAATVPEALQRMRGQGLPSEAALVGAVKGASSHRGEWPTISVWHGLQDHTVVPTNGEAIVSQWLGVHGLDAAPSETLQVSGHDRRIWRDRKGVAKVEAFAIERAGHGTPLDGADGIGVSGAFMLDAGISSTRHIAAFWQIAEPVEVTAAEPRRPAAAAKAPTPSSLLDLLPKRLKPGKAAASGPGKIIEDALKAAGLMR
ncbi:hypothetical protein IP69_07160 [Bosea sp. AAP35]|uniref:extracellular catalytic domain type 1 short-chain-length polyhydroxyalkanoate depolymerase n=1 Tax=Bosea sp. AAP35 TaxID=1523417 RepID=UPI0006B8FB4F|nr:PHB depolymerase family esterase [Bosea sp. AAP35]KPF71225.1 hypothetical protein IP69_07160 [Bosea sp. AAP35]